MTTRVTVKVEEEMVAAAEEVKERRKDRMKDREGDEEEEEEEEGDEERDEDVQDLAKEEDEEDQEKKENLEIQLHLLKIVTMEKTRTLMEKEMDLGDGVGNKNTIIKAPIEQKKNIIKNGHFDRINAMANRCIFLL